MPGLRRSARIRALATHRRTHIKAGRHHCSSRLALSSQARTTSALSTIKGHLVVPHVPKNIVARAKTLLTKSLHTSAAQDKWPKLHTEFGHCYDYGDPPVVCTHERSEGRAEVVQSRVWFDDQDIDGFWQCMRKEGLDSQERVWVVPAQIAHVHSSYDSNLRHFCKAGATFRGKPAWILAPCLVTTDLHWILLRYHARTDTVYVMDSYNQPRTNIALDFGIHCKQLLSQNTGEPPCIVQLQMPQQTDCFQCGPWVCAYLMAAFLNRSLPEAAYQTPSSWIAKFRHYLACTWLTNQTFFHNAHQGVKTRPQNSRHTQSQRVPRVMSM